MNGAAPDRRISVAGVLRLRSDGWPLTEYLGEAQQVTIGIHGDELADLNLDVVPPVPPFFHR